jgi:hypothetical protein
MIFKHHLEPPQDISLCFLLFCNFTHRRNGKKSEKKEEKSAREATTNRNHIFRLPPVLGLLVCQDYTCIHGGIGMEFIS